MGDDNQQTKDQRNNHINLPFFLSQYPCFLQNSKHYGKYKQKGQHNICQAPAFHCSYKFFKIKCTTNHFSTSLHYFFSEFFLVGSSTTNTINNIIIASRIIDPTAVPPPSSPKKPQNTSNHVSPSGVFTALRKIKTMPMNIITMKNTFHPPSRKTPSPSLKKEPISNKKRTLAINRITILADTSDIISTSLEDATTKNAITKAA